MKPKVLGIITARGGSKGIPGKNIKSLLGKPLISYTIEEAKKSGVFDRLILSTDSEEIAEVAKKYNCEVPFIRPVELAEDQVSHLPVIQHAVTWLKNKENYYPDYIMILQPTSPLRRDFHIKEAVDLLLRNDADSVLSVVETNNKQILNLDNSGFLKLCNGDPIYKRIDRRQFLPKSYISAGLIYLFKTDLLFSENPNFYGESTLPYIIDNKYVADIDNLGDWKEAEEKLKKILSV